MWSIIEVHMKSYPFKKLFNIHVRGKKISIQQKMTKIRTFENKVQIWSFNIHSYLLVKVFVIDFFNPYLFFHHVSYIEMKS
jgi:hypothetical protein